MHFLLAGRSSLAPGFVAVHSEETFPVGVPSPLWAVLLGSKAGSLQALPSSDLWKHSHSVLQGLQAHRVHGWLFALSLSAAHTVSELSPFSPCWRQVQLHCDLPGTRIKPLS